MTPFITEIIGLPLDAGLNEIVAETDRYSEQLATLAAGGDAVAQHELLHLHIAYLVWAYAKRETRRDAGRADN